jgi:hypothetical protein
MISNNFKNVENNKFWTAKVQLCPWFEQIIRWIELKKAHLLEW